jgi:hypothetical protein
MGHRDEPLEIKKLKTDKKKRRRAKSFTFVLYNAVYLSEILSPTPWNSLAIIQFGIIEYGMQSGPRFSYMLFASIQSLPYRGHPFGVVLSSTITPTWINLLNTGADLTPKPRRTS